jgi:hypothetical protein
VRIDPTAAVAPERIELGIDAGAAAAGDVQYRVPGAGPLFSGIRELWDAVNNGWNQWVLGYDLEHQLALMALLGVPDASWADLALWLAVFAGLVLPVLWLQTGRPRRPGPDPLQRLYRDYCRRLGRVGLARRPWEGPRSFQRRVTGARPDLARAAEAVTDLYVRLRYGPAAPAPPPREELRRLRRVVRQVRPRRTYRYPS